MVLRVITGAAIITGGLYALFIGIVFMIASGEEGSGLIKGITFIIAGLMVGTAGIFLFRAGITMSPEAANKKILKLAAKKNGEVPEEYIIGEIGNNDSVDAELNSMIDSGIAKKIFRDGRTIYIFPGFNL